MTQPTYSDTDFTSLGDHTFDVTFVTQAAGTYVVHLDGGPYTGSGATLEIIRDAVKTEIDAGTHINWSAAVQGTDAIRITSLGPGQHISGAPGFMQPRVEAPAGGAISMSNVVPFEGIDFMALEKAIEADAGIPDLVAIRPIRYTSLLTQPRIIQANFIIDQLSGAQKTALDMVVANFVNFDTDAFLSQFARSAEQVPFSLPILEENLLVGTAGPPDGGLKFIHIGSALQQSIVGLQCRSNQPADASEVNIEHGRCQARSGDGMQLTSLLNIDLDVSGAGGLDTGTKANDTWYAIYLIAKPGLLPGTTDIATTSAVFSVSVEPTGPTMPAGYTHRRFIGDVLTGSTGNIEDYIIFGRGRELHYLFSENRINPPFRVLSAGASQSFALIELDEAIPKSGFQVRLMVTNDSSPNAYLRERPVAGAIDQPFGSISLEGNQRDNPVMGVEGGNRQIEYCMSSAGGSLKVDVIGYEMER